jgi:hypothetical protein
LLSFVSRTPIETHSSNPSPCSRPHDLIPDAIPILGWLDDLALITLILPLLLKLLPEEVLTKARRQSVGRR